MIKKAHANAKSKPNSSITINATAVSLGACNCQHRLFQLLKNDGSTQLNAVAGRVIFLDTTSKCNRS